MEVDSVEKDSGVAWQAAEVASINWIKLLEANCLAV
jgi:hypothetical protein